MVRTRVAVSPTGYPHIGTIYQALFDFAYAKKNNGKFIVRIEDTDRVRFVVDAEEKIFDALDWFGLVEDESVQRGGEFGPYRQSERLEIYQKFVMELVESGHAYYCFCSKERLEEVRKKQQELKRPIIMYDKHCRNLPPEVVQQKLDEGGEKVVRLKVPDNEKIVGRDEIRGEIVFESKLVDDQVLLKADGFPTYHLAVVVDDHLMKITHVVRGEEWIPSLPKQVLTYRFLGWEMPKFYHTAVLRNPDHSKLSKRQGHTSVEWYKENGFLPEAILNYIASLGWGHPQGKEVFPLAEFIELFDLKDIRPAGAVFDIVKLSWMNGVYIRQMANGKLQRILLGRYPKYKALEDEKYGKIVALAQSRMETLNDFDMLAGYFLEKPDFELTDDQRKLAKNLSVGFESLPNWESSTILEALRDFLKGHNIKMSMIYKLFTGQPSGLPLPESLKILGREKTLSYLS